MGSILILYHSQEYGNTAAMAQAVAEGARAAGASVTLINTNEERLDLERYRLFDTVAFGSPDYWSYIAGGLKVFLDDWYLAWKSNRRGLEDKPYGLCTLTAVVAGFEVHSRSSLVEWVPRLV
jgi:NAD(P)H dehydrogenase (quinone)